MEKSLIDIYDSNGNIITMELLLQFNHNTINYIVYKDLDGNKMYAAKYIKSIDEDFNTYLTKEELELVNKVYEGLVNENNK